MIYLYEYEIPSGGKTESLPYLQRSWNAFLDWEKVGEKEANESTVQVKKDENGKPFVEVPGFFLSATHSGKKVICAVSRENIGIDGELPGQRNRACVSFERIARRFFTNREQAYVNETGAHGFYEIWVRKEAFMKYTGLGMAYGFRNIETRGRDGFLEKIDGCRILFFMRGEMYFACAGGTEALRWMGENLR